MKNFFFAVFALCLLTLSVRAQPVETLPNSETKLGVFLGANVPLRLKFKDLTSNWRVISVNDLDLDVQVQAARETTYDSLPVVNLLDELLGARPGNYFTQWQTATTGNDSFLIAYRVAPFSEDAIEKLFPANKRTPPTRAQFMDVIPQWMSERPLSLALLNLKTVKIVQGAHMFKLDTQVERVRLWANKNLAIAPPKPKTQATQADDLRELALSIVLYAQDNDDTIPPMNSVVAFKKAVTSYIKSPTLWRAETKPFYMLNPILSNKKMAHIATPRDMVTLYETQLSSDGLRGVAFLDGHNRRLNATEWLKYKRGSKIK